MGIAILEKNFDSGMQAKVKPAKDLALLQKDIQRLPSTIPVLSEALEGGFSFQSIHEWGVPPGSQGREVVLSFLTQYHAKNKGINHRYASYLSKSCSPTSAVSSKGCGTFTTF